MGSYIKNKRKSRKEKIARARIEAVQSERKAF